MISSVDHGNNSIHGVKKVTKNDTTTSILVNSSKLDNFIPSRSQIDQFHRDGYLILDELIDQSFADHLANKVNTLFSGKFETGVYPDEWWGRPGISLENITKEMVNAWKSDRSISRLVFEETLGMIAATLMGWSGARVAQDDIFWKPVSGKPIGFHQDLPYMQFFDPSEVVTIWVALTDVSRDNGTLEYCKGSNNWKIESGMSDQFHAPSDYMSPLKHAALVGANIDNEDDLMKQIIPVEVKRGGCSIHHGKTWHGSATNPSNFKERKSIAIHFIPSDSKFASDGRQIGYIYGRYKLIDNLELNETFFPISWTKDGYQSSTIKHFI